MSSSKPGDCAGDADRRKPEDSSAPTKEVTSIPIGIPESDAAFRQRKERARRPQPAESDVNIDSDQEE